MAAFKITVADSAFETLDNKDAFKDDGLLADSLTVDYGAYLIAQGLNASAAELAATGAWTATINGMLVSKQDAGIHLLAGNTGVSKITIGADAGVSGDTFGIFAQSAAQITNKGSIFGSDGTAIQFETGINALTNSGTIIGDVTSNSTGALTLTNNGTINGDIFSGDGNDVINNTGTITGGLNLGVGKNTLSSTTRMLANINAGAGDDAVTLKAGSDGAIALNGGNNKLTATGSIAGIVSAGSGDDTITIKAALGSDAVKAVALGAGNNTLNVTGNVGPNPNAISAGAGNDVVTVNGDVNLDINLGGGKNTLTVSGKAGNVFMDAGDDTVSIKGDARSINLGEGKNVYTSSGQITEYFGGDGDDILTVDSIDTISVVIPAVLAFAGNNKITIKQSVNSEIVTGKGIDIVSVFSATDIKLGEGKGGPEGNNTLTVTNADDIKGGSADDFFTIKGNITGDIDLFEGNNTLISSGTIAGAIFTGTKSNDTFILTAGSVNTIQAGDGLNKITSGANITSLSTSSGDDILTTTGGTIGTASLGSGVNVITNAGTITALTTQNGSDVLTNKGTIGTALLGGGDNTLTNSGTIITQLTVGDGSDIVKNTGTIGNILLAHGANTLTNSGKITGTFTTGDGIDKITNSGTMESTLTLGAGDDVLTNTGTILGTVNLGDGINSVSNSKTLESITAGATSTNTVTNKGLIVSGVSLLGSGKATLTNSGTIDSIVVTGDANDLVTNTGKINSEIDLGDGNDVFKGGNFAETVADGNGDDNYNLGGGNDTFLANHIDGASKDVVDGGAGIDTYSVLGSATALLINLNSVEHDFGPISAGTIVAANTAEVFGDQLKNFENVTSGDGNDLINGTSAANELNGSAGNDILFGGGGNDTLIGDAGTDNLVGGAGKDTLTGGTEADQFLFFLVADSGTTTATRDVIVDFTDNEDQIVLKYMDADTTVAGTNAFEFIGENIAFTGDEGDLRAVWSVTGWVIEGDVNGDSKADFSIAIDKDATHLIEWDATDFVLI